MNSHVFVTVLCDMLSVADALALRAASRSWRVCVDDERVWALFRRRLGVDAALKPPLVVRRACFEVEANVRFLLALARRRHPVLTSLVEGNGAAYSRDDFLSTLHTYRAGFTRGYLVRSLGMRPTREHDVVELEREVHRALTSAHIAAMSLDELGTALERAFPHYDAAGSGAASSLETRTCATLLRLTHTLAEPLDADALACAAITLRPFGARRTASGGLWLGVGDTTYSLESSRLVIVVATNKLASAGARALATLELLLARRLSFVSTSSSTPLYIHGHLTRRQAAALAPSLRLACGATVHCYESAYTLVASSADQMKRAGNELAALLRKRRRT